MLIDWFTVLAQALNFLVLVYLLKRYLYQPILRAIDAREQLIATELAQAAAKKAEAQGECASLAEKQAQFEGQRAALLARAGEEAAAERGRLIDAARLEAEQLGARHRAAQDQDAVRLSQAIARRAGQEVFAIARKALGELAAASLEERICAVLLERLARLDDDARAVLAAAPGPARVRSAFALPDAQKAALRAALAQVCGAELDLRYEITPELLGGIELSVGGQKLEWSIAAYLDALQGEVAVLLERPAPEVDSKAEPKAASEAAPAPQPAAA
ncbi:F-type H+-transporting ATPase subunit b [Oxalobacteraceae bacterium GrIS 1.11]